MAMGLILFGVMATFQVTASVQNQTHPYDAFQGQWTVKSIAYDHYEFKGTSTKPIKITFTKNRMLTNPSISFSYSSLYSFGSDGNRSEQTTTITLKNRDQESIYKLDPDKNPAEIDLEEKYIKPLIQNLDPFSLQLQQPKNNIVNRKGIYRFTEKGLELCIASQDSNRPTEFKAGAYHALFLLHRDSK